MCTHTWCYPAPFWFSSNFNSLCYATKNWKIARFKIKSLALKLALAWIKFGRFKCLVSKGKKFSLKVCELDKNLAMLLSLKGFVC